MSSFPQTLYGMELFVDGFAHGGTIEKMQLPKLKMKTEEYRGGGMNAPVEVEMGMESLNCRFTLNAYRKELFGLLGLVPGNEVNVTCRGYFKEGQQEKKAMVVLHGSWKELDFGEWAPGTKPPLVIEMSPTFYALTLDNIPVITIDIVNDIRMIGGVDQLAGMRAALGR
ncbi:phage major tail tube protein [Algicola sagamiensis]|uniref:phage major tail tube protein n=1 Tax=Algicola sagamiensis TaxID=163869 RepID=UPI00036DF572|nr:phage major tail tube protein [Algicola sagamiensis]